ncbi:TraR/DksA C4-type zinc finger protein [candidate division KSB1 bacterium]|nr:TraR/DksA C4-type zinc finger protein [candidate division KSB1 bacterium]
MDKKDTEYFKQLLLELLKDSYDQLRDSSKELNENIIESSGEVSSNPFHLADIGTDVMEREKAFMIASMDSDEIFEINHALEKIDKSEFGYCEQCNHEISKERLEAVPYARLCLPCKAKEENK